MSYKPCRHCLGGSRCLSLSLLNLTQPVTQTMACCQSMDNIEPTFFETSVSTSDSQGKNNKWRRNCIARKRNWNWIGEDIGGQVRIWRLGRGNAIAHPVATWTSPQVKRSKHPLTICSSTRLLERSTHIQGDGLYAVVCESWKYDL